MDVNFCQSRSESTSYGLCRKNFDVSLIQKDLRKRSNYSNSNCWSFRPEFKKKKCLFALYLPNILTLGNLGSFRPEIKIFVCPLPTQHFNVGLVGR